MTDIVIAAAARTPIGAFNGALSSVPAHDLGEVVIRAALVRAGVDAADVNDSGLVDIADSVFLLESIFLGGAPIPVPTLACGQDPTVDDLSCEERCELP